MSNGTLIGADALERRWSEWCIVLAAGRMLVGRVRAQANVPGSTRRLSPVYDFQSGFVGTPQGIAEVHSVLPFLAFQIEGIDLPDQGIVLIPFSELSRDELHGMEGLIAQADELKKNQRAARSGVVIAPPNAMPKTPPRH